MHQPGVDDTLFISVCDTVDGRNPKQPLGIYLEFVKPCIKIMGKTTNTYSFKIQLVRQMNAHGSWL